MRFLVAAALCVLAFTSGVNAETQTQTQTQTQTNNINNQVVSSAFSRLAADVATTIPMNVESAENKAIDTETDAAKLESSLALVDPTITDTRSSTTDIIICPSCVLPRADLIPTLTISSDAYSIVYPPNSISVKNIGNTTSKASIAKLWCRVWTNTFPPQIIPGNVVYDGNGQAWGLCFSDITFNIPPIAPGASYYPPVPYNPWPLSCRKPAGKCEVHFKVDVTGTNFEKSELNNEVIRYKTNVASNPPNWP